MENKSKKFSGFDIEYAIKYVIQATLDDVVHATEILDNLIPNHFSEESKYFIKLGVSEILTNIVIHGHICEKFGIITIFWKEQIDCLLLLIIDTGLPIPQNLLLRKNEQFFNFDNKDIKNLPVNGFGLGIIKSIFNTVNYYSIDNINYMHLKINFSTKFEIKI